MGFWRRVGDISGNLSFKKLIDTFWIHIGTYRRVSVLDVSGL